MYVQVHFIKKIKLMNKSGILKTYYHRYTLGMYLRNINNVI